MRFNATLAVVLCVWAAASATASSVTAFEKIEVPAPAWEAVAVGPRERSVVVVYTEGGCLGPGAASTAVESAQGVSISLREQAEEPEGPLEACANWLGYRELTVPLARRLAGRRISGGSQRGIAPAFAVVFDGPHGEPRVTVPRIVGFSPSDARRAIASRELRERIRPGRAARGLPRVVAQFPRPGAVLRRGGTVKVRIAQ